MITTLYLGGPMDGGTASQVEPIADEYRFTIDGDSRFMHVYTLTHRELDGSGVYQWQGYVEESP